MITKTNKSFIRVGNKRRINLDYVRDIMWEFDNNDINVIIIFFNGECLDLFLNEEEFCEMLEGLNHAEI